MLCGGSSSRFWVGLHYVIVVFSDHTHLLFDQDGEKYHVWKKIFFDFYQNVDLIL